MGHKYLVAAFCCTWGIQLGYLLWMTFKWKRQEGKLNQILKSNQL